ncbi:MAG: MarR family transcriptional regulator [Acidimicrobiaceae bacterium]|jgi:DNA-binding MarR family transcriptional regulator
MAPGTGFLDDYLPYLLRRADQTLSEAFYAVLTESGVARSEWRVLAVLEELGPLSVLDLTDAALSPQPTVTHAVRRLEARGLVTRTAGATDRRQRIVAVTEEGAALTRRLIRAARRLETAALADLGGGEDLVEPLRRLISSLEGARA